MSNSIFGTKNIVAILNDTFVKNNPQFNEVLKNLQEELQHKYNSCFKEFLVYQSDAMAGGYLKNPSDWSNLKNKWVAISLKDFLNVPENEEYIVWKLKNGGFLPKRTLFKNHYYYYNITSTGNLYTSKNPTIETFCIVFKNKDVFLLERHYFGKNKTRTNHVGQMIFGANRVLVQRETEEYLKHLGNGLWAWDTRATAELFRCNCCQKTYSRPPENHIFSWEVYFCSLQCRQVWFERGHSVPIWVL